MTASATHATLATFRIDLTREEEQRAALERFIVPGVQRFPGFISGHWTVDREAAESLVLLTYESRVAAETMSEMSLSTQIGPTVLVGTGPTC